MVVTVNGDALDILWTEAWEAIKHLTVYKMMYLTQMSTTPGLRNPRRAVGPECDWVITAKPQTKARQQSTCPLVTPVLF